MSLSEKFQTTVPVKEEGGEKWAQFSSVRKPHHEGPLCLPDGQAHAKNAFAQGFGGNLDAAGDVEPSSMRKGYQKQPMKPTDDIYTAEHLDLFYLDVGGFLERNNYLDRE